MRFCSTDMEFEADVETGISIRIFSTQSFDSCSFAVNPRRLESVDDTDGTADPHVLPKLPIPEFQPYPHLPHYHRPVLHPFPVDSMSSVATTPSTTVMVFLALLLPISTPPLYPKPCSHSFPHPRSISLNHPDLSLSFTLTLYIAYEQRRRS